MDWGPPTQRDLVFTFISIPSAKVLFPHKAPGVRISLFREGDTIGPAAHTEQSFRGAGFGVLLSWNPAAPALPPRGAPLAGPRDGLPAGKHPRLRPRCTLLLLWLPARQDQLGLQK